jgi:hypothetical protein
MSQNKTQEDLLKEFEDIKKSDTTDSFKVNEHSEEVPAIIKFIIQCNIRPGNKPVKTHFLFKLFKYMFKDPTNAKSFSMKLREYINIDNVTNFAYIDIAQFKGLMPEQLEVDKRKRSLKVHNQTKTIEKFDQFMVESKLEKGDYSIPNEIIYRAFYRWFRLKISSKTKRTIYSLLKKHFEQKQTSISTYSLVKFNDELRKVITEDEIIDYIREKKVKQKRERERYKKRRKLQAQKGEIPGFRPENELKKPPGIE